MLLTFNQDEVRQLVNHAVQAESHSHPYGIDPDGNVGDAAAPAGPQLQLVYDEGIYLMSNGNDHPKNPDAGKRRENGFLEGVYLVAYADQANPRTMGHHEAYDAKRYIAGGDDGVDSLNAAPIAEVLRRGLEIAIELTETHLQVVVLEPKEA